MASPYDPWRNTYGMPGPQDPNRPGEIRSSQAPRWEELFRGSDVTAINSNPLVQALQRYINRAPTGISETTRLSPIDYRPRAPEPSALDKLPPTVQEGIGGLGLLANFLAPGVRLPAVAPKPQGIRAYHGSPHDFDRFDMGKIGTGEGAQAYGHGLYFAEAENVARSYRDKLSDNVDKVAARANFDRILKEIDETQKVDPSPHRVKLRQDVQEAIARLDTIKPAGRMYEVNINADPERFLDWDKPLSGQSEAVSDAINRVGRDVAPYGLDRIPDDLRGVQMKNLLNNPDGVARLKELGIPGIRYKDAMSRGAADGTSNYVVFDADLISILRKYGLLPPAAAAGASMMEQQEPPL